MKVIGNLLIRPFADKLNVGMVNVQFISVILLVVNWNTPLPKVVVTGLKIHEPNSIGPVAVWPLLVMVKLAPENDTVVGPVVPNSGTPFGKVKA